jgi:hypothetical protein
MALSKQTLDHLLEVESHLRSAIKCAAVNENPTVVSNLGKILLELDSLKRYEKIIDMLESRKDGSSGLFDNFSND